MKLFFYCFNQLASYFRIPVFMKQWEKFLEVSKEHTTTLSVDQRHEIATYLVPEVRILES